jgi:hypothetical protein
MDWALIALAAIQTGMAIYQSADQIDEFNDAQSRSAKRSVQNQSELVREEQRSRREAQGVVQGGTVLGSSNRAKKVSEQGTVLTQNTQTRSLLGN